MSKYIDAEKLKAEIEKRFWDYGTPLYDDEVTTKVNEILSFIDYNQKNLFEPSKEDMDALLWVTRTGISTQPVPHHVYIKKLYEKLKEYYEIHWCRKTDWRNRKI